MKQNGRYHRGFRGTFCLWGAVLACLLLGFPPLSRALTWTERQPAGDANMAWHCVSSDADGSHLIAAVYSGRLYTSSDSGANWTERRPAD